MDRIIPFDESFLQVVGNILTQGQLVGLNDETFCSELTPDKSRVDRLSIFNQHIETPELGFAGLPITKIRKFDYTSAIKEAMEMVTANTGVEMNYIINHLREHRYNESLVCILVDDKEITKTHIGTFYVREVMNTDDQLHPNPDKLDMMFMMPVCELLRDIPHYFIVHAIIQKVVALCSGLLPGKLYCNTGATLLYVNQKHDAEGMFKKYRSRAYIDLSENNNGLSTVRINQSIFNKWRSHIKDVLPNLSDFNSDGSDFEVLDYTSLEPMEIPYC